MQLSWKRIMNRGRTKTALALVLGLGVGLAAGAALAADTHSHSGHAVAAGIELTLDHGKKWATDEPLRHGMGEMRRAMAAALPSIHTGQFAPAEYERLGAGLESQIDYVTTNCKLSPEADMQLHVVLGEIIDGVDGMRRGDDRQDGAVKVVNALDAYGAHFDHRGWEPLSH